MKALAVRSEFEIAAGTFVAILTRPSLMMVIPFRLCPVVVEICLD